MKARINHGSRGKRIETLLKRYGFEYPQEYYDMVIESYINGNFDQCIEEFNAMKGERQRAFLMDVTHMGYIQGERVQDFIISNL